MVNENVLLSKLIVTAPDAHVGGLTRHIRAFGVHVHVELDIAGPAQAACVTEYTPEGEPGEPQPFVPMPGTELVPVGQERRFPEPSAARTTFEAAIQPYGRARQPPSPIEPAQDLPPEHNPVEPSTKTRKPRTSPKGAELDALKAATVSMANRLLPMMVDHVSANITGDGEIPISEVNVWVDKLRLDLGILGQAIMCLRNRRAIKKGKSNGFYRLDVNCNKLMGPRKQLSSDQRG